MMDLEEAKKIIEAYDALVDRAIATTGIPGTDFHAYIDTDSADHARLSIEDDKAVLTWNTYESDYYGGGHLSNESAKFDAAFLFLSEKEFKAGITKIKKEIAERDAKVRKAQEKIWRERQEANERAMLAQLRAKYGT